MKNSIQRACEIITSPDGESFLRLMRDVCHGDGQSLHRAPRGLVDQAFELGLFQGDAQALAITADGYVVGGVAKEYCNYLDFGRVMPPPKPDESLFAGKDVLDVGCSIGRWLWWFQTRARSCTGIEMSDDFIALGRALSRREQVPMPRMVRGSAEEIERLVPGETFDFIFCRLVMNHVQIRSTLAKLAAVLRAEGRLWIQVETHAPALRGALGSNRRMRSRLFDMFALVNTLVCLATGRQMCIRLAGRMNQFHKPAFPPLSWWRRALTRAGFSDMQIVQQTRNDLVFHVTRRRAT